jgi:predicted Rossmann fold nucleotide-binding protein DprA/Smf involved in DNA uptake
MQETTDNMTTDQSKAVIVLTSRLGDPTRPSLSPPRWSRLHTTLDDQGIDVASVFDDGFNAGSVEGLGPDDAASIDELLLTASAATIEASELESHGISVVTILDDDYPHFLSARLGPLTPPVIFVVGNRELLTGDGIGIVGSRNVDEPGKSASEAIAREAVNLGRTVISGAARGVDTLAMAEAFRSGGNVVGVLADSMKSRIRKPDILAALDEGRLCLISQQNPSAGFSPASAMGRNKLVYSLCQTTVVIATDLEAGGTWAGATEALKKHLCDVAVWMGEGVGPGNARLVELGGRAIDSKDQLLDGMPAATVEQLSLTDLA